jgi:hypothetical protein
MFKSQHHHSGFKAAEAQITALKNLIGTNSHLYRGVRQLEHVTNLSDQGPSIYPNSCSDFGAGGYYTSCYRKARKYALGTEAVTVHDWSDGAVNVQLG